MGNGKIFQFKGYLGDGNTTRVLDIGNGLALRIPLKSGNFAGGFLNIEQPYRNFLKNTVGAYQTFEGSEVPLPKLHMAMSDLNRYLVVERVDAKLTLKELQDFVRNGKAGVHNYKGHTIEFYETKLLAFIQTLWKFERISDFRPEQIAWDGQRWILLDPGYAIQFVPIEDALKRWHSNPIENANQLLPVEEKFRALTPRTGKTIHGMDTPIEAFLSKFIANDRHEKIERMKSCHNAIEQALSKVPSPK
jgi:hypothetical protein